MFEFALHGKLLHIQSEIELVLQTGNHGVISYKSLRKQDTMRTLKKIHPIKEQKKLWILVIFHLN